MSPIGSMQAVASIVIVDGSGTSGAAVAKVADPDRTELPPIDASFTVIVKIPGVGSNPGPKVAESGAKIPDNFTVRDVPGIRESSRTELGVNVPYKALPPANAEGVFVSREFENEPKVPT
jgi:hypothetical protein